MTIYALSSGIGTSGIAVVRISGPDAKLVIEKLTSGPFPLPRIATLKKVNNINRTSMIDEGIVIWYPGPNSYTGEDMSEIQVHGSRAVVNSLLKSISHIKNCRLAEPGEFTKIALRNGKIDNISSGIGEARSIDVKIQPYDYSFTAYGLSLIHI